VVLATRDVRTFEKLTERDREEQRLLARSAEQRAADDQASARWSTK
jgi:flagellar export protein FliJ